MGVYLSNHICLSLDKKLVRLWSVLRLPVTQNKRNWWETCARDERRGCRIVVRSKNRNSGRIINIAIWGLMEAR